MNRERNDDVERDKIKLDESKYFLIFSGNIHYELSRSDAREYFSMILDLENDLNDDYLDEQNNSQDFIGRNDYEEFKEEK